MEGAFDVAVVGGGPAGSVAALLLARTGRRVALVEKSSYERDRVGESVGPRLGPMLAQAGLWERFQQMRPQPSCGVVSFWGSDHAYEQDYICSPQGQGWRLDRRRFDRMLAEEAERAGVRLYLRAAVRDCVRDGAEWRVEWPGGGVRARYVMDASGRPGLRTDSAAEWKELDRLVALVAYGEPADADERAYIEAVPEGWWYSAVLPDGRLLVTLITDVAVGVPSMAEVLRRSKVTMGRVCGPLREAVTVSAATRLRRKPYGEGWLAIGDSAASLDPLCGSGVQEAIRQAVRGVGAHLRAMEGDGEAMAKYGADVAEDFGRYAEMRKAFYGAEQRWAQAPFWRARMHWGRYTEGFARGLPMTKFETTRLSVKPVAIAPDGTDVRTLLQLKGGSLAHFEFGPGQTGLAVAHRTVEEIWYFIGGKGEMWRQQGDQEEIVPVEAGVCLTIPLGTKFQFRSYGYVPLQMVVITMPPWPGGDEAYVVNGKWEPTVQSGDAPKFSTTE